MSPPQAAPGPDDPRPGDDLRRGSSSVAAGILVSRLAGLLREILTARLLGTGVGAEAFKAALRVPNLLQNLLGEGVLSASFVPVYASMRQAGRAAEAARLAGAVIGLLLTVVAAVVTLVVAFAEPVTRVLAWGFVPGTDRFELTVSLVRIVTPGVGLLVVSAWCLAILNAHRRFFLSYVAPAVWNVAIIAALVGAAATTGSEIRLATAMAWGALAGSALQVAVQLPRVLAEGGPIRPALSPAIEGVGTVARRFGQVLLGRGGVQLAGYVDLVAASLLAFGAVAALGYAQTLYLLPIALFGMSVAAAELPTLSTMDHSDRHRMVVRLEDGLGRIAFFVVPTALAFLVAGDLVVGLIFGGGRFSADAAVQVGVILAVYALGLPASTGTRLLQSVLYGVGDARRPAAYALGRVVLAAAVGILAMLPLDAVAASTQGLRLVEEPTLAIASASARAGPDNLLRMGAVGLALGSAAGAWTEYGLLRRRVRLVFGRVRLLGAHGRSIVAGGAAAVAGAGATRLVLEASVPSRLDAMAVLAVMGLVYLGVTRAAGVPEARDLPHGLLPPRD